ncbi:cyclin-T isoform X1 [Neodiprion pinetum]|uniref:cyclin-T isoform X1 n=2 Tax=Neodiprion pinetum TaxID=441929 RepID=UPI001EDEB4DD|nr:cyclin-T isoform X1 [Neodiprion pinetum]XP_046484279.1 cyclin-T isoform X1 [Neodiprion pinetum]
MAADEKWYFTKEQLATTPSRRCGFDADKELSYRQQAANFIQDMGQRLSVSQLCINTAIVYMHRFYVFHSLAQFHRNAIAVAALFLAAKVEEQPRKLEVVIKVAYFCLHREQPALDTKSEQYLEQAQDLVFNENVLLQTLGFNVAIDHPHTHVVRCCQLVKASKDLAQTSYFMASNSLHLTTMCLQYKPTVVACFCIHLACKWSNWEVKIPQSNEGKHWFWYVDRSVTSELLQQLTAEFLHIFDKCPSRLKKKIMSISANQSPNMSHASLSNSPYDLEARKIQSPVSALDGGPTFQLNRTHQTERSDDKKNTSSLGRPPVDYREHREKKERERLEREKAATTVQGHSHHHKPVPSGAQIIGKHSVPQTGQKPHAHHNHHHLKPATQPPASQYPSSSRHSGYSQTQRESSRDPARQRMPREYNSSSGTSGGTVFTHGGHGVPVSENSGGSAMIDPMLGRNDQGNTGETSSQDKQGSNSSHGVPHAVHYLTDNKHLQSGGTEKRQYDPARHKPPDHRKEESQKLYSKYAGEGSRVDRQKKQPDILEQRCEEVRKLIEKPLPLSLTTQKSKEEYPTNMSTKQSHHHSKVQGNPVVVLNQMKGQSFGGREKSPGNPASAGQQMLSKSKPIQGQYSGHHGVAQIMKETVRNGNAGSPGSTTTPMPLSIDDIKTDKKPRPEELERIPAVYLSTHQTPPGSKHRSLFSPEKSVPNVRESLSHSQRAKPKQKTPPSAARNIKQESISMKQEPIDLVSPFASPPGALHHPGDHPAMSFKRGVNELAATSSSHKRHRASSVCEPEQPPRVRGEDAGGLDAVKSLGRIPELIQPIRDNSTPSNGKSASVASDLKPPELIKPFEPEPQGATSATNTSSLITQGSAMIQQPLSNGYDPSRLIRQDFNEKREPDHPEYLPPLKSARSISALLQENTPPPIPSLLQQQMQQQQLQQQQQIDIPSIERVSEAPAGASATVQSAQVPVTQPVATAAAEEKRSEHHKSEKKKKKEKHKHKDRDKGKEERKHKHKHKDREKEKHHRDKERSGEDPLTNPPTSGSTTVPIKITIPKDKINLGGGGDASLTHTPSEGSSLKIKIPKERLKGGENTGGGEAQVQAPLKIKIRTGPGIGNNSNEGRKRERDSDAASPTGGVPPSKKHSQAVTGGSTMILAAGNYQQQPRQQGLGERQQNGRHYTGGNTTGNNKEKHSSSSSSSSYYKTSSKSSTQHSSHPT